MLTEACQPMRMQCWHGWTGPFCRVTWAMWIGIGIVGRVQQGLECYIIS